ncbi:hypothetical protein HDU87_006269 [Geranomyces variabilis]|uniref:Uncharacterized protein n=1 Tax=Geranomyces variabilis TaxID=109894 RepID=A0AAD5TG16_9FUNG|nr:hypothetical protein HDU87_006269 [Geranomyces variabilis]
MAALQDQQAQVPYSIPSKCHTAISQLDALETQALQSLVYTQQAATAAAQRQELRSLQAAPDFWGHWKPQGGVVLGGRDVDKLLFETYADVDLDDLWRAVRDYEQHAFPLEDREVAKQFFEELEGAWVADGPAEGKAVRAWDDGDVENDPVVARLEQRKKKRAAPVKAWVPRAAINLPGRKTTSAKRLAKELAERNAMLDARRQQGFPATPIPASTLIPKYAAIIAKRSTRSALLRAEAARDASRRAPPLGLLVEATPPASPEAANRRSSSPASRSVSRLIAEAAADGQRRRQRHEENEKNAGLTDEHIFHPKVNHEMPDFRDLQSKFAEKLKSRKKAVSPTRPQPFPGVEIHHTHLRSPHKKCVDATKDRRPKPAKEAPKPSSTSARNTFSSKLRETFRKELERKREAAHQQELADEAQRQEQRKKLQARIRANLGVAAANAKELSNQHKRTDFQARQRERDNEYLEQLEKMKSRVESRPCLFEQVEVDRAARKAVKGLFPTWTFIRKGGQIANPGLFVLIL